MAEEKTYDVLKEVVIYKGDMDTDSWIGMLDALDLPKNTKEVFLFVSAVNYYK